MDEAVVVLGILCSISSVLIAYIALKRNMKNDNRSNAFNEGILINDISNIKSSILRIEKVLDKQEELKEELIQRVIRVEENLNAHLKNHS